jgi:hypothetical protein
MEEGMVVRYAGILGQRGSVAVDEDKKIGASFHIFAILQVPGGLSL